MSSSLRFGFTNVSDLFDKLQRDAVLLDEEVTSDRFFNFVITGHSMIDWVRKDSNIPESVRDENTIKELRENKWLKVCGEIANANKHFRLDKK
ncbi:MAG: hypothetical protein Q9M75_04150, partial [Ghiorsea sp.]|nr:hypothetical protein [Ghiorsea sp.]